LDADRIGTGDALIGVGSYIFGEHISFSGVVGSIGWCDLVGGDFIFFATSSLVGVDGVGGGVSEGS
jgi:hypothetical protein